MKVLHMTGTSKLKRHTKENDKQGRPGLRSGAARQRKKTKLKEKVEREDQVMLRHAVKRSKSNQVMEIGFALRSG